MDNDYQTAVDEGRSSRRGRLMGKLFGAKEKAQKPMSDDAVNDFLHASSDSLHPTVAPPSAALPALTKLDTRNATRYPQALDVASRSQQNVSLRARSRSPTRAPKRNRKGFMVRFVDTPPEIIGEGGDESPIPTIEISKRKNMRPPPSPRPPVSAPAEAPKPAALSRNDPDNFVPAPIKRTQTGYSSIAEPAPPPLPKSEVIPGIPVRTRFLDSSNNKMKDENRRSFLEIQQAEMRQAEGQAFAQAARSASVSNVPQREWEEAKHSPFDHRSHDPPAASGDRPLSPETNRSQPPAYLDQSPSSVYSTSSSQGLPQSFSRQPSMQSHSNPITPHSAGSVSSRQAPSPYYPPQDPATPAGDDALSAFQARTRHLSELFRLHAETVRPVSACATRDLARASLWWFLRGRMGLESSVRARPVSPQEQMQNEMDRQQAYTNLAKSLWLAEEAIPEIMLNRQLPPDPGVDEVRRTLVSNLKKLSESMKKNGFLPPEEAFLPQTLDKSIWVEYPKLSQDMVALLTGNSAAAISGIMQQPSAADALDALPTGDGAEFFSFGRISVDAFLMEQGRESQTYHFPCLLSTLRPQKQQSLVFVIASQNGEVHLRIQGNKNIGPTWDDVRWKNETCVLEVLLPRGFKLAVQCLQQDYRMLWNMYDFGSKTQATLYPRKDEQCVFRSTLRAFQFFDSDPQSRVFPKDSLPSCDAALFEKVLKETSATGPRSYHRGLRLAVVTGARTRTLSGVNPSWTPQQPISFGFLRGESGDPALMLKCDCGRQKGTMVLSFNDEKERLSFHTLLSGTAVLHDETVYADVQLSGYTMGHSLADTKGLPGVNKLPWQAARVINDDLGGDENPPTVLSDKLRVVVESQVGTITDRVNVETGELRLRLEVNDAKSLIVMRRPQNDVTIAVSDAQLSREVPKEIAETLQMLQTMSSIRTFKFPTLKDLHLFQAALTGFEVKFDGLAVAFAISRRRMVVPIHKKWDAGWTRIQVVQQEKVLQLLAFFPDFQHGQCMNFVLKGTDVFEMFSRSSKYGLRIVDAKFPLPRMPQDNESPTDDMGTVCLDLPDLPGEHDDISLLFEQEADRDRLCQCLPAPVKGGSRLASKMNF